MLVRGPASMVNGTLRTCLSTSCKTAKNTTTKILASAIGLVLFPIIPLAMYLRLLYGSKAFDEDWYMAVFLVLTFVEWHCSSPLQLWYIQMGLCHCKSCQVVVTIK